MKRTKIPEKINKNYVEFFYPALEFMRKQVKEIIVTNN